MKTTIYILYIKETIYKKINNLLCIYFYCLFCGFSCFGLNFKYSKYIPIVANVAQEIYITGKKSFKYVF